MYEATTDLQGRILSRATETSAGYETPCWLSDRAAQPNGYTKINIGGRTCLTHRVAYEAWRGPIPDGLVLDHLCRNRACCNPEHLEPVTMRINTLRGDTPWARARARKTCVRGHPMTGDNVYRRPDRLDSQDCRECRRMAARKVKVQVA